MRQFYLFILFITFSPFVAGETMSLDEITTVIESQTPAEGESAPASLAIWEEAKTVATRLQQVQDELAEFEAKSAAGSVAPELTLPPILPNEAPLPDLSARLTEVDTILETSRNRLAEATAALDRYPVRISELSQLIARNRDLLAESMLPPSGESDFEKAQSELAMLTRELLETEIQAMQGEQSFLQGELDRLPERIRERKEHNAHLQNTKERLQIRIASLRRKEAQITDARLDTSFADLAKIPLLAAVISEVKSLNQTRTGGDGLQARIQKAAAYERRITRLSQQIREQRSNAKQKIELLESVGLGIDTDTGILLREQRAELPSTAALQKELSENVELAVRTQVALVDLQDKLASHPPISSQAVDELLEENVDLDVADVSALFEQRRTLLESSIKEHRNLRTTLDASNAIARETIARIEDYSAFLDKRLLWSKSTTPLTAREPVEEWQRVLALFEARKLAQAWESIRENWFPRFLPALFLATAFLFGLLRRKRLKEIERQSSDEAARRNCTAIRPTVHTVVSSTSVALTFPALLFLGALLIPEPSSLRMGFLNSGILLLVASLVYRFAQPKTLFESHFKFSPVKAQRIRNNLRVFTPILLPFVFLVGALGVEGGVGSSGRFVFIITMLIVACFAHQLFHPKHSIVGNPEKATLVSRLSYLLAMGFPLSFAIGAALGFFSSVLTLRAQVLATAGVLLGAFLVIRFFTRWILVSRRKLAITQALQRREAALAEREREESGDHETEADVPSLEEVKAQAVDVVEVEEQTSQLLRFGVYFSVVFAIFSIWSSSLKALSILDQKPLWPNSQTQVEKAAPSQGSLSGLVPAAPSAETGSSQSDLDPLTELVAAPSNDFVSWQDLLLSLFIFLITFVAARNIPGLLSLAVFSRLNLGPGGNFAFTTIVRYFIVLFGVVIALNKIGITWDKVQWLAAAITLGIGFGLQEIFANFVAGLILLFERPLRIGDIVTVGDVSGKVTEIKIRATTIQQFNNRDLVVPNKDFITNQLTNWTLKDSILRFELMVGIAYGSDTRKAEEILKRIVEEHPHIIDEPAPQVIFNAFGASTLDFIIRAHVGQVGNLVSTQHELHFQIDDAFREAGIEIAFPQQDIHLRSVPEGLELKRE